MKQQYPDLPAWLFDIDEVSAGVYEIIGRDNAGHNVSAKGTDVDSLLDQCKKEARRISLRASSQKN